MLAEFFELVGHIICLVVLFDVCQTVQEAASEIDHIFEVVDYLFALRVLELLFKQSDPCLDCGLTKFLLWILSLGHSVCDYQKFVKESRHELVVQTRYLDQSLKAFVEYVVIVNKKQVIEFLQNPFSLFLHMEEFSRIRRDLD